MCVCGCGVCTPCVLCVVVWAGCARSVCVLWGVHAVCVCDVCVVCVCVCVGECAHRVCVCWRGVCTHVVCVCV